MLGALRHSRMVWLGLGLVVGLVVGGLLPSTPLHATATDRSENVVMATGYVDDNIEAVFFLDSLTGMLTAAVPSIRATGMPYQAVWRANVGADMMTAVRMANSATAGAKGGAARPAIEVPKTPRFVMTTGQLDIRQRSARLRPARCVVYVTEANTGLIMTYALQWSLQAHSANQRIELPMTLWAAEKFATAAIRSEE
jgi:hypothetical protein